MRRSALGLSRYRSRNTELKRRRLWNPLANAIRVTESDVSASRRFASSRRCVCASSIGDTPSSRSKARRSWRSPDAQLAGEVIDTPSIQGAGGDAGGGRARQPRHGVHQGPAGRQLGTAAKAGAEASLLGGGGGIEETSAIAIGDSRRTNRATVDPGCGDAYEEEAIKPRIAGVERAMADGRIEPEAQRSRGHRSTECMAGTARISTSPTRCTPPMLMLR